MKGKQLRPKNTTKRYHSLYVPIPVSFADDAPRYMRAVATAVEEWEIVMTTGEPA
jgi:hypothetical protein